MKPLLAIDVETKDLSAKYDINCPVWSVATYGKAGQSSFFMWSDRVVDDLNTIIPQFTLVFHNGAFDVPVLRMRGVNIPVNRPGEIHWLDTALMSYALAPSNMMYHSLASLAPLVGEEKDEKPNFQNPEPKHLEKYNVQDARITYKLGRKFLKELQEDESNWQHFCEIEMPYTEVIIKLERGITINRRELAAYEKELHADTESRLHAIQCKVGFIPTEPVEYSRKTLHSRELVNGTYKNNFVGVNKTTVDGKKVEVYDHCPLIPFNPNSGDHIAYLLTSQGYESQDLTKSGKIKTDAKTLESLHVDFPLLKDIAEYKKMSTQLSNFVRPIGEMLDSNSILRGSFNQFTTATRRLSSSKPNLQNIPARGENGAKIRKLFVARPGCDLVVGDLDRIEVCVLAFYLELLFGSTYMSDAIRNKIDVHQVNADLWSVARRPAKNTLFCVIYGGGPKRIAITAGVSLKQGNHIYAAMERNTPEIFEFRDYVCETAIENDGYFHDWFGARYYVPEIMSNNNKVYHAARRQIANYAIQGTAGSIFKYLQLEAEPIVEQYEAEPKVVVHDEGIYEAPCEVSHEFAGEMSKCFTREDILVDGDVMVPVSAEFNVADNWYDAKGE